MAELMRPTTIATATERPRKSPSTNASLTSPMPRPDGESSAAMSRNPPAANAAISELGQVGGVARGGDREARDAERQRDAVGEDAVAQVDRGQADQREGQQQRRDQPAACRRTSSPTAPQASAETSTTIGRAVMRRVHSGCSTASPERRIR